MKVDFLILGGGLSGCLLVTRLASLNKNYSILVVEKEQKLGGHHTWSFHDSDIPHSARDWFLPLVSKRWDGHSVRFPKFSRQLKGGYGSIRSQDFDRKVRTNKKIDFLLGKEVTTVGLKEVFLNDGTIIESKAVVDARGFGELEPQANAYQKFVGLSVRLKNPHGLKSPVLMDATVEQLDGYRFMYLLPWSDTEILLEDTYYSDTPDLPVEAIKARIHQYLSEKRWDVAEVQEVEVGVLPIPLFEEFQKDRLFSVPTIGVRAGVFNRTTGFSLPVVLQLIEKIVDSNACDSSSLLHVISTFQKQRDSQHRKFCFLNRVLFRALEPHRRYSVLEQFYEMPEDLISKFYATQMSLFDWARFFARKPPAPIGMALRCGFGSLKPQRHQAYPFR